MTIKPFEQENIDQVAALATTAWGTEQGALAQTMMPRTAKLAFFISRKPGYGTPLLEALVGQLRQQGSEWLYLWTDTSCSHHYYPRHDYELVGSGNVPEFSTSDSPYDYYFYRKHIIDEQQNRCK